MFKKKIYQNEKKNNIKRKDCELETINLED